MGMRALPLSSSHNCFPKSISLSSKSITLRCNRAITRVGGIWATAEQNGEEEGEQKISKQSLFSSITEALDFSQARSSQDAQLIEEAKEATKSGGKMNREQYGALRRKIGGTYKDFFKSYLKANMWKKGGLTKHAGFARETPEKSRGKSTSLEDMFMWHAWGIPNLATFSSSSSQDEVFKLL
ncbi:hypothetical protein M5K25_015329 [Dendrobium thyrsiflorum]|uniref:GATA-type transcription activator N-terminal domain-containing protein n=1 Tax=Dendrobium thyrsiflorum TaxID=117978 RepID=A0ABD0UX99_DENTH